MPNSKQIVYLSQSQYAELIANGTITVDGVTVTYDENDIYVTPQAEPVTDVRVNGTSIAVNGVANIPLASADQFNNPPGLVKIFMGKGFAIDEYGHLVFNVPNEQVIKRAASAYNPISPFNQHKATFYGLAKVAGHDEASSTEPVGTYTPEAKGAIQQMLGVSDLIATSENDLVASKAYAIGDVFTANGKLYKATSAIAANDTIVLQNSGETVSGANAVESSVGEGFVKFTDVASSTNYGVVKLSNNGITLNSNGALQTISASDSSIKGGTVNYNVIVPKTQHTATFYGLAKVAGADEKDSTLPVGQYTDTAKSAIRTMLGAVGSEDYATSTTGGIVKVGGTAIDINSDGQLYVNTNSAYGIRSYSNSLAITEASTAEIKTGTTTWKSLTPGHQHESAFYGLAKAAGDTTQSQSNNAVGTYTDEAKAAIKNMIGVNVEDVQVNGTSVISNGVANVPIATNSTYGVIKPKSGGGTTIDTVDNTIILNPANSNFIKQGTALYMPVTPLRQHESVFYGLAKASGDTTQSASSNAVGTYTDNAKASIKSMLGIVDGSTGTVDVTGAAPTITAVENTRYVCGEVTSLNVTPAASGICIVRFTSGSTPTVLTLPSTVKFPEWFDPTSLETDTIYEMCITDGIYGAVMSWAL